MVKDGYKQTDIGMIPEDWIISQIDEHCTIRTGAKNTQDKKENGVYPFFVRSQIIEKIDSYSFDGEAVLTAGDGVGTGKVYHYINGKFDFHQRVYCLTDFSNLIDGYFFYLYFKNNFFNRISKMTAKSSVDSVRREMIAKMLLPIPPKEEQKAIAKALSDADELINSLEKLISKKEAIKQGTMQQLLTGKKRLNGFSDKWEEKKLGDIFEITAGGDLKKDLFSENKDEIYRFPIYANSIFQRGLYGYSSFNNIDKESITVTARGNLGVAFHRKTSYVAIGRLLILQPKIKLNCLFCTESINLTLDFANESTSVPQLTAPQISNYNIFLPKNLEEQNAIAQILSDMENEIETLKSKLSKTKAIKDGIMSELLTGKTRLKVKDE